EDVDRPQPGAHIRDTFLPNAIVLDPELPCVLPKLPTHVAAAHDDEAHFGPPPHTRECIQQGRKALLRTERRHHSDRQHIWWNSLAAKRRTGRSECSQVDSVVADMHAF